MPRILGGEVVQIDLNRPMSDILATLSQYPIKTRLSLTGTDDRGARSGARQAAGAAGAGQGLPDYFKNHPVYYAGPAKTPVGFASGSFGPTTAGRMDSYRQFQAAGGSHDHARQGQPLLGRARCLREAWRLLSRLDRRRRRRPRRTLHQEGRGLEFHELGMEAIWRIEVENFPAFIIIDDKGNDFFKELNLG